MSAVPERLIKSVKNGLLKCGAEKVVVREELDCIILEAPLGNDVVLVSVFEGMSAGRYVIKMALASKAVDALWGCEGLKLTPHGLYAVVDDDSDVREVILKKIKLLLAQH